MACAWHAVAELAVTFLQREARVRDDRARSDATIPFMIHQPDVTVAAVVADGAGRFLVVEEHVGRRLVFNQPAGHVEKGETLIEAIIREVREETAWRFEPRALLGVYRWRNPSSGRSILRFAFSGTVADHDPGQPLDKGIVRTHWLSRADLLERAEVLRSPLVMRCVEDYRAGRCMPLEAVAHLDLHAATHVAAVAL